MRQLGYLYEDKFVRVGKELGYNFVMERMDVNMAQEMWNKVNINTQLQRIIMRYMKASFGNKYIIPSSTDTKNDKSRNIGNYESIDPLYDYCEIDNEVVNFWTKP
jgi:hypothetical protein